MSNPFETIDKVYKETNEEINEKGYSDMWKKVSEMHFETLGKNNYHVTDIEYLDGYFIFAHGNNSVVHYHIKECPGWKFGIWWYEPKASTPHQFEGSFFMQYEEDIDKFKPSASNYSRDITVYIENGDVTPYGIEEVFVLKQIEYIKAHKGLAWYNSYHYMDYNYEYVPAIKADIAYRLHKLDIKLSGIVGKWADKKILNYTKKHVIPAIPGEATIEDRGEGWVPRYQLMSKIDDYEDTGFDSIPDEKVATKFDKYMSAIAKIPQLSHSQWYYKPLGLDVLYYVDNKEEKFQKS